MSGVIITALDGSSILLSQLFLQNIADLIYPHVSPQLFDKLNEMPEPLIAVAQYNYLIV